MQVPQYIFTKAGVSTNSIELRNNQQKLLQQSYQKNIQKPKYSPRNPHQYLQNQSIQSTYSKQPQKEDTRFSTSRLDANLGSRKKVQEEMIKNSLSDELSSQIAFKQQLKKFQKEQILRIEKQMVQYNRLLRQKQISKQKGFFSNYKEEAIKNAQLNQLKKQQQKNYQLNEKNQINQQYKKANEIIQKKINGTDNFQTQTKPSIRTNQSSLEINNLNPEISKYPFKGDHRHSVEYLTNLKLKFKENIIQQIRLNQQRKMNEKLQKIKTPFVEEKYKIRDNPIVNPIDLKMAKDNPYLMKELLGQKTINKINDMGGMPTLEKDRNIEDNKKNNDVNDQTPSKKPSYLSLRGSSSLSKLAY